LVLLAAGFAVFFTTYEVYGQFLGGIDGLPALPRDYWPSNDPLPVFKPPVQQNEADRKLRLAFGQECPEVMRSMRLFIGPKGLVLAANEVQPQPDGRVMFKPFSVAIFSKDRGDLRYPEINTVRCSQAFLTFDRPITNQTDMGNRKIIGGELRGPVTITNNRRTPQQADDIEVEIRHKPLFFREQDQHVWTDGTVRLLDTQNVPNRTEITAEGMDLYLTKAAPETAHKPAAPKKPHNDAISGVDRILLRKNVTMHLWVDERSGFPGGGRPPHAGRADGRHSRSPGARAVPDPLPPIPETRGNAEPRKAHVMITTNGPFAYDVPRDQARFDIPAGNRPNEQVAVRRIHELGKGSELNDQLFCEHLELQFRRKPRPDLKTAASSAASSGDNRDDHTTDREIESAHATGQKTVILTLDSEYLDVQEANDLVYHAATPTRGPETTLKGNPLKAVKDCNRIEARELWLRGAVEKGGPQQARAIGPGQIDLADRSSNEPRHPVHITWNGLLTSTKDGVYDLLTLTGGAAFVDDDHDQFLRGETLQVWLEPAERDAPARPAVEAARQATPATTDTARQRPHRVEAFKQVSAHSPEMNIREAEHLLVKFRDVTPARGKLPAALPQNSAAGKAGGPANRAAPEKSSGKGSTTGTVGQAGNAPAKPARKPINIWAWSVVADVNRIGPRNELQKVLTQGAVHVQQDGATPRDKGVDIKGDTLELLHQVGPEGEAVGDLLIVLGDSNPAQLQLGEMFILGPRVTIDQKENTADVQGIGAMRMPSKTTLDGDRPARPGSVLEVHWIQGMLFNGKDADFHGGVVAKQDEARLQCRSLQVSLDRFVNFKEGQKGGQAARVDKLVSDRKVYVEDQVVEKGKRIKYQRLVCHTLAVDNQQGRTNASGPGVVILVQPGPVDNGLESPPPAAPQRGRSGRAPAPPREEMKRTQIEFEGSMLTINTKTSRLAKFWDKVEVVSVPSDQPDLVVDKDKLPLRGMYLSCERLEVFSNPTPGAKAYQTMNAEVKVFVKAPEFSALADKMKYDEAKDLIIFEGNPASFSRFRGIGVEPQRFNGRKIYYWRSSRQFKLEDGGSINTFN
jgi:hypothetical protein